MSKKAKNIIVLRHGQSEGNIDKSVYDRIPDYRIQLTQKGREQAAKAAEHLAREFEARPVGVYVSPFTRTIQTEEIAARTLNKAFHREDCRLREREWTGRLQSYNLRSEMEKKDYGNFFYRYHGGESCADAAERAYSFRRDLIAQMEKKGGPDDFLLVSHGEFSRVFGMVLATKSVYEFEKWPNMFNCAAYRFKYAAGEFEWVDGPEKNLEFYK
jgi:broad specificity phosphatase PhoE